MTPNETAAILRQFNEWRLGDEDLPQPDPKQITAAIYAALEMIDRLEAAEKERDEFKRACFGHISDNSLLRAKIAEMEKQEPVAWRWELKAGQYTYIDKPEHAGKNARIVPLYALPSAQPSYLPSDLAEAIIADMQAQYDSELITENDSCEALIRLDGAIAAVEDNFAAATEAKP